MTQLSQPRSVTALMASSVTEEEISRFVDLFYLRVRTDERLGPIFESRLEGRWPLHLQKMKSFWSSVLLKTGRYSGRPVPIHQSLDDSVSEDYRRWLAIFRPTAKECFNTDGATDAIEAAERIAQSLWLATFSEAATTPPGWFHKPEHDARYSAPNPTS